MVVVLVTKLVVVLPTVVELVVLPPGVLVVVVPPIAVDVVVLPTVIDVVVRDRQEIADLPWHTYDDAGARVVTACTEVLLSERTVDAILARGLMPILSFRDSNAVRVARFQSVADPSAPLAGPWAA